MVVLLVLESVRVLGSAVVVIEAVRVDVDKTGCSHRSPVNPTGQTQTSTSPDPESSSTMQTPPFKHTHDLGVVVAVVAAVVVVVMTAVGVTVLA